jgi:hypothetical protein
VKIPSGATFQVVAEKVFNQVPAANGSFQLHIMIPQPFSFLQATNNANIDKT